MTSVSIRRQSKPKLLIAARHAFLGTKFSTFNSSRILCVQCGSPKRLVGLCFLMVYDYCVFNLFDVALALEELAYGNCSAKRTTISSYRDKKSSTTPHVSRGQLLATETKPLTYLIILFATPDFESPPQGSRPIQS
jgi:hypothetical protein